MSHLLHEPRANAPIEPESEAEPAHEREGRHKARTDMSLFVSLVEHERYCSDFRQWKVIVGCNIDFSSLEGS